jgi:hypothetical protein
MFSLLAKRFRKPTGPKVLITQIPTRRPISEFFEQKVEEGQGEVKEKLLAKTGKQTTLQ